MPNEVVAGLLISIDGNTVKLRTEMDKAKASTREASRQMKTDMMEARAGIKQVGEEIGLGLNRHLTSFLAKLPGVAPLMAAAFPVAAVVGITMAVVEFGKKIGEMVEKARGVAGAIGEGFGKMHESAELANTELAVTNDKLEEQIAKLTGKHANTLKTEIDEAAAAADKLYKSLKSGNEEVAKLLKENQVTLMGKFLGQAGTKEITAQVLQIQHDLDEVTSAQKDHANEYREQMKQLGDSVATRADRDRVAAEAKKKWDEDEIARQRVIVEGRKQMTTAYYDAKGYNSDTGIFSALKPGQGDQTANMTIAGMFGHHLVDLQNSDDEQGRNARDAGELKTVKDSVEGSKKRAKAFGEMVLEMVRDNERLAAENERVTETITAEFVKGQHEEEKEAGAVLVSRLGMAETMLHTYAKAEEQERQATAEYIRQQRARLEAATQVHENERAAARERYQDLVASTQDRVATGDESPRQRVKELQAALQEEHKLEEASFQTELADYNEGTREYERILGERQKANAEFYKEQSRLQREAMEQGLGGALNDIIRKTTDLNADLKEIINGTLSSLNSAILKTITEPHARGQWKEAGKSIFTGVASKGLDMAEGSIMKGLGLGGGKLGTRGNPMYTRSADPLPGASGSSAMSSLLNPSSSGASGAGGAFSKFIGSVLPFFGFMADGGTMHPGGFYLAGERGPELLQVGSSSRISNARDTSRMLSGGGGGSGGDTNHHWNIDARGSHDPAAVRQQVLQGINEAAPKIVAATLSAQRDIERRRANIRS